MPTPPPPLSIMKFADTPINLFRHNAGRSTVTSDAFEGGLPFDTPADKVLLTRTLLMVELPFIRTENYASPGFAVLPSGIEVDTVRISSITIGAPSYTDTFLHILYQGNTYLLPARTSDSNKWPAWTSSWAASFSAAMTCEFHLLGRLGLTSWGDYLILTAE